MDVYADVQAIYLEEEPRISAWRELAQTRNVVIVPFFISDGMHTQEDIPVLLGEAKRVVQQRLHASHPSWRNPTEKDGKLVWYTASVGTHPDLVEVILERVREAAKWV
jgi:sirohydrochlorin cobaltochelatase